MASQFKVCITGARGFVGKALECRLSELGTRVLPVNREPVSAGEVSFNTLVAPSGDTSILQTCSVIVHLAARVHVMNEGLEDPLEAYRKTNVHTTLALARKAAAAGVQRFLFISSIKVNGEHSQSDHPFSADQFPIPSDPYGVSKCEAEAGLRALSQETGMDVVIIRPPLVYGPGVKANFLAMMRWLCLGIPLPLGGITENRRSLVFLDNLVDLIVTCIDHPAAANQTFLVSDDEDLSTAALLRGMAAALGRPARLITVPVGLITLGAKMIGCPSIAQRLCGSLQVDIGKTKELLGWSPPVSVAEGLRRTAAHWLATERTRK